MLKQSFSLENFEEIYDEDNRKGKNQDNDFFPEVVLSTKRLSNKARALRAFKNRYSHYKKYPSNVQQRYDTLFKNLLKQKIDREEKITDALTSASANANRRSFRVGLSKYSINTKDVYERDSTPESYYVFKQITRNIRSLYKTKPANRNLIVSQIRTLLEDGFPYVIIKTDIRDFFESIDQSKLVDKFINDQLLSTSSIKVIKQVLWEYSNLSGTTGQGIPRGLGISSDLAELFLKSIDKKIQELENVTFYARYVDDIFILISPDKATDTSKFLPKIRDIISDNNLNLNEQKTKEINRRAYQSKFDYLGYEFTLLKGNVDLDITLSKFDLIKNRINNSFASYEKQRHKNAKFAYRLLLKRARFLTTNTRLINNKNNAFVGVFFNNPSLNKYKRLSVLDIFYNSKITNISSASLRAKLQILSFVAGHEEKSYTQYNKHKKGNQKK